jgi:peptidoglycan/LPS O-acetylase OafA/YrhL
MRVERAGKANNLDLLRLLFAVLVIASHSYPLVLGSEVNEPLSRWTHGQVSFGGVAVDGFFIISGFLITASMERSPSIFQYLKKRIARIYPGFLVCAALTYFFIMPIAGASISAHSLEGKINDTIVQALRLREFKYSGAFLTNPFPGVINGSVWSIQYEFWCYLGVALLAALKLLRRRWVIAALFFCSIAAGVASEIAGWHPRGSLLASLIGLPDFWARLIPFYGAGVVFYLYRDRISYRIAGFILSLAALAVASFFPGGWALLAPVAGTYALFYLAYVPQGPAQRFGRFGDFSYGTYLYAFPVQQILIRYSDRYTTPMHLFLVALPLTLVVAIASWYGVERHFLRSARRKETPVLHLAP